MVQAIRQRSAYGGRTTGPVNAAFIGQTYALSDNPFNIGYTVAGEVTYSETNHRATFGNSSSVASVARVITGYGVTGQNRAIEFESVVKPAQAQAFGLRPSLTQNTTATQLGNDTGDVAYVSTGSVFVSAVEVASGLTALVQGDKLTVIYVVALGTVAFLLNGVPLYTASGIAGDMTPACQGRNANTHSIRVSTASSYPLPGGTLYWR